MAAVSRKPASRASVSSGALLSLQEVDEFQGSDSVGAFWQKLLELFVGPICDSFSVGGCQAMADLAKVEIFADWQPALKDSTVVRFQWDVAAWERTRDLRLGRFALGGDVVERLGRLPFAGFEREMGCSFARLFFFSRQRLILEAEPGEQSLVFYEMTPARRELLHDIEPGAARALNDSGNWTATTLISVAALQARA
ncbi:MAG TPA: hypothetical protein VFQ35_05170 [Polyangiaceae bacterium]|nr:hypothetical protein [Polyangiaceae bacterium]